MKVRYSYLPQQFKNIEPLWRNLKKFVPKGDFTLGNELNLFERKFATLIGAKYAIGVNSGTDAIKLSLKYLKLSLASRLYILANFLRLLALKQINQKGELKHLCLLFAHCLALS